MNKINQTSATKTIYNLLIVDESGSMQSIADQTRSGYREILQTTAHTQTKSPDLQQVVSLVSFNTMGVRWLFDLEPIDKVMEAGLFNYQPDGGTPLWDAIGCATDRLKEQIYQKQKGSYAVFVSILSDGYENASERYSASQIRSYIEGLSSEGWSFTYIGMDHDVASVADSIGIAKGNRASIKRSECKQKGLKKVALAIERMSEQAVLGSLNDGTCLNNLMEE